MKINLSDLEDNAKFADSWEEEARVDTATLRALISVARAAQAFIKEYQELRDERMVSTTVESELEEALKEIE